MLALFMWEKTTQVHEYQRAKTVWVILETNYHKEISQIQKS